MIKIPEIMVTDSTGFFTNKDFAWSDIKPFSIITGINGSGKTQLLEYVANSKHFNSIAVIRYIDAYYQPPSQKHANELAKGYNLSLLNEDGKYYGIDKDGKSTDWTENTSNFKNNNVLKTLDYAIIDKVIQDRKKFQNDNDAFEAENSRINKHKETHDIQDLLPAKKNDDQPWDRIDRILGDFGLLIRLDRRNLNAGLEFLRRSSSQSNLSETTFRND